MYCWNVNIFFNPKDSRIVKVYGIHTSHSIWHIIGTHGIELANWSPMSHWKSVKLAKSDLFLQKTPSS